ALSRGCRPRETPARTAQTAKVRRRACDADDTGRSRVSGVLQQVACGRWRERGRVADDGIHPQGTGQRRPGCADIWLPVVGDGRRGILLRTAMTTALITHPACLKHEPPPGHPERPARLQSILTALDGDEFRALLRKEAPEVSLDAVARVHDRNYIEEVLSEIPSAGVFHFDADTAVSPGSREAILRAAGALVLGVDMVIRGDAKNVFCAVRPPGHHAMPSRAMGFCLFNNVAIGAAHAHAVHGVTRVAVVDFDVHHGNRTEGRCFPVPNHCYRASSAWPLY